MKSIIFIFSFLIIDFASVNNSYSIDIEEAIKQKLITATANGIDVSKSDSVIASYYGACVSLTLTNNGNATQQIEIKAGQFFLPEDSNTQRLMCTQAIAYQLLSHETLTKKIFAMCTYATHAAPLSSTVFKIKGKATNKLMLMAQHLSKFSMQNSYGQHAIWAVTNNYDPASIKYSNTTSANALYNYVVNDLGIKYTEPVYENGTAPQPDPWFRTVKGTCEIEMERQHHLTIKIFNEHNQLLATLVDTVKKAGTYSYTFNYEMPVNSREDSQKYFIVRYYYDGNKISENTHKLKTFGS